MRPANLARGCERKSVTALLGLAVMAAAIVSPAMAEEWPQWRGPNRDGVWTETGIVKKFAKPRLARKWSVPVGSGYSGPTIADGRVYVTDRLVEPKQVERVHCFDWKTGETIWMKEYDCVYSGVGYQAGPRASVLVRDGKAYSLGTMGHLACFDAATGKVLWSHDCNTKYNIRMPVWGICASPVIEGNLLIVEVGGSNRACFVAFNKDTGKEVWRALDDNANYAAPFVIDQAGKRVLICWTGNRVAGLAPRTGQILWSIPWEPQKMPLGVATPVLHGDYLFMTGFYDGSLLLKLGGAATTAEVVWGRRGRSEMMTDALHSIIGTPLMTDDAIYGVDSYGELRCLDLATGERLWENLSATPRARWSTIHTVTNGDRAFLFNERGELIIGQLSRAGFKEISRAKLIDPTEEQLRQRGGVCWSHPAYAYQHVFARNDNELVCASLIEGEN